MCTVVVGCGIIGLSTAYYLALNNLKSAPQREIRIIESSPTLFTSASGRAGGFLSRDMFQGPSIALGKLSFDLHKELAEEHDGRENWGYSVSSSLYVVPASSANGGKGSGGAGEDWLREGMSRAGHGAQTLRYASEEAEWGPNWLLKRDDDVVRLELSPMASGAAAQVDPLRLCQWLLARCLEHGVKLHQEVSPSKIVLDSDGFMSGLQLKPTYDEVDLPGEQITCDQLLITAGAWSSRVFDTLFPSSTTSLDVSSYAGYSVVFKSPRWEQSLEQGGCHAIFIDGNSQSGFSPEIFSRLRGEIWIGGLNTDKIPLPELATDVEVDEKQTDILMEVARRHLGDDLEVQRTGLCHRPVASRPGPIISDISDEKLGGVRTRRGVWVSTGHGPWGISLSLGSGKIMSEMLLGKNPSVPVAGFRLR